MSETITQTADERAAVDRIKYAAETLFPHLRWTVSVSDMFMDAGDVIAAEIRRAVAAEREECAKLADDAGIAALGDGGPWPGTRAGAAERIAAAIRARK